MSVICMLHCLSIPLLLILGFDALLAVASQEWLEAVIVFSALAIGLVSFLTGYARHKQHFVVVLFGAGFLLLVNGEAVSNAWASVGLSVAGALTIAYAHVQNLRFKHHARA